jgi:hypothetical protein
VYAVELIGRRTAYPSKDFGFGYSEYPIVVDRLISIEDRGPATK